LKDLARDPDGDTRARRSRPCVPPRARTASGAAFDGCAGGDAGAAIDACADTGADRHADTETGTDAGRGTDTGSGGAVGAGDTTRVSVGSASTARAGGGGALAGQVGVACALAARVGLGGILAARVGVGGTPAARLAMATAAILAGLGSPVACAQFSGSLGLASGDRYRGTGTPSAGAVFRASAMVDLPGPFAEGGYAGLSGLWRTRDGGLANMEAIAGWSGRWNAWSPWASLDPAWGWDLAVHRKHYGANARYDFTEAMAGLLAPNASARLWWSPHYFGSDWASVYAEANGRLDLDGCWRVVGHVGVLRYGNTRGRHLPGRTDALAGLGCALGDWDVRLTRDGLLSGRPFVDADAQRRSPAWVLAASVVF
jgi:hypothetical protein